MVRINSWYHSKSCAKKYGGKPEDYIEIHSFIDSSKSVIGDVRHRSMYHHTMGIFLCEKIFGRTITVGTPAREVPVRLIAELHVMQDLGWIPSPVDYINNMELKQWMGGATTKEKNISDVFPLAIPIELPGEVIEEEEEPEELEPEDPMLIIIKDLFERPIRSDPMNYIDRRPGR